MYLIQLFLPLYDNEKQAFPKAHFLSVRDELVERFGGLTVHTRAPAKGLWQDHEQDTVQDDLVIHEVMSDTLDEAWWRGYRQSLEKRFRQDTILVRAQSISIL
ncbi:hypothetical protein [Noviherbaspirillum sp.]|uniref:hypothetical protein n=1 Tax=Noviherbaspirillum sp. TaxID=1926288 RepID=UPI002FE3D565